MVSAQLIERHTAHCRKLNLPYSTHPRDVQPLLTPEAVEAGEKAVADLEKMLAWAPVEYDRDNPERVKETIIKGRNIYRHMAFWGGRGGAKSHDTCEAIIELASVGYESVVCGREFMTSIRDSSRKLLAQKIAECPWVNDWTVTDTELRNNRTGSLVTFIGMNRNPDSARSLEGCTIFFGEESASFSDQSLEVMLPTIRSGGSICIWLWNPVDHGPIDKMFRGGDPPERSLVRCVLGEDNIYFYRTEMPGERRQAFRTLSKAKFRHIWRGALDVNPEARVFSNWRVGRVEVPDGIHPQYGLDWGWIDPLAALEFYVIEPEDPEEGRGTVYIHKELYGTHIPANMIPSKLDEVMPDARHAQIVADSAEPKSIDDLNTAGFNVVPARKGPGSIRAGISTIQGYDVVISPDCPHTAAEFEAYSWKVTKNGVITRDPEDQDNHTIDALRYGFENYVAPVGEDVIML